MSQLLFSLLVSPFLISSFRFIFLCRIPFWLHGSGTPKDRCRRTGATKEGSDGGKVSQSLFSLLSSPIFLYIFPPLSFLVSGCTDRAHLKTGVAAGKGLGRKGD